MRTRTSRRLLPWGPIIIALVFAPAPASAHNEQYRLVVRGGGLWADLSLAGTFRASPIIVGNRPSLAVVDGDIGLTVPWFPIEAHLRAGADWRTNGTLDTRGFHIGGSLGINFVSIFSEYANWGWMTDPYFSPLNPSLNFTFDVYDIGGAMQAVGGIQVSNTMFFGCYVGVRMSIDLPYTTGPGIATTFGLSLVVGNRWVWDDAAVGCGDWRDYVERSAHAPAR
jgi:hypothetical protein